MEFYDTVVNAVNTTTSPSTQSDDELKNELSKMNIFKTALKDFDNKASAESVLEPLTLNTVEYKTNDKNKIVLPLTTKTQTTKTQSSQKSYSVEIQKLKQNYYNIINESKNLSNIITLEKQTDKDIQKPFDIKLEFKKYGGRYIFNYLDKAKPTGKILSVLTELYNSKTFTVSDKNLSKTKSIIYDHTHISDDYNDMIVQFSKFVDNFLSKNKINSSDIKDLLFDKERLKSWGVNSFALHKILRNVYENIDEKLPVIKSKSCINYNRNGYESIVKDLEFDKFIESTYISYHDSEFTENKTSLKQNAKSLNFGNINQGTEKIIKTSEEKDLWINPFLPIKIIKENNEYYIYAYPDDKKVSSVISKTPNINLYECDKEADVTNSFKNDIINSSISNETIQGVLLNKGSVYRFENKKVFTLNPLNFGCMYHRGRHNTVCSGCGGSGYGSKSIESYVLSYTDINKMNKTVTGLNSKNGGDKLIPYFSGDSYTFMVTADINNNDDQYALGNKNYDDIDDKFMEFNFYNGYYLPNCPGCYSDGKHTPYDGNGYTDICEGCNTHNEQDKRCTVEYKFLTNTGVVKCLEDYYKGFYNSDYKALLYKGYSWYFVKENLYTVKPANGFLNSEIYLTGTNTKISPYAVNFIKVKEDIIAIDDRMALVYKEIINNNIETLAEQLTTEMFEWLSSQPEFIIPYRLKGYLNYVHTKQTKGSGLFTNIESPLMPGVISVEKPLLLPHLTYLANKDVKFNRALTTSGYQIVGFEEETKTGFDTLYTTLGKEFALSTDGSIIALVIPNNSNPYDYIKGNPIKISYANEKDLQDFEGDGNGLVFMTRPLSKTPSYTTDEELDAALKRSNATGNIFINLPMVKVEETDESMKFFYTTKGDKIEILKYIKNNYSTGVSETTFEGGDKALLITKNYAKDTISLPSMLKTRYKTIQDITGL